MNNRRKALVLDLLIAAMEKLAETKYERQNVIAFVESCYGGLVRRYDFDSALRSLSKLTADEQHVLIEHVLQVLSSRR